MVTQINDLVKELSGGETLSLFAKMMRKYYTCLITEGFSEEQAIKIITTQNVFGK